MSGSLFDDAPGLPRARGGRRPARDDETPGSSASSAMSVMTLTRAAKDVIEGAFPPLWVRGEVSDFKAYRSGHWYFSLRDADARVRCVMWKSDAARVQVMPENGMLVTAQGQMTVYPNYGDLQLRVTRLGAEGDGLWRKALEQTIARLKADGLLDPERKRPLPLLPRCVAVITSPDGAAWHDIRVVSASRFAAVRLVLVPSRVQGEGTEAELVAALQRVARWGGADVVIIGRGGGAREDLWAFNDERVARAVADCPVPVIAAVGHEVDTSVVDLVADLRAATPSAAAEAAVPDRDALLAQHADLAHRLRLAGGRTVVRRREQLRVVGGRFAASARRLRAVEQTRLERLRHLLGTALRARLVRERATLEAVLPGMRATVTRRLADGRTETARLGAALHALSPLATLDRGFAVARDAASGRALPSAADVSPGQRLDLLFRDGAVRVRTEHVRTGDPLEAVTGFPDE
ncbi:MAG: exodeoxyribonuclease VII large subunit [Gemmatimonadaceae bacterium]|jgi:exodeoxyribonuclease VII large subunit|nr:exodeoxyribonuclease VII large subunit [Gemmatimonadaceae bacterium]